MPFVHKETGKRITGVETRLERVNSIQKSDNHRGWSPHWAPKCWPIVTGDDGKALMKIEGGGHCSETEIEWREP